MAAPTEKEKMLRGELYRAFTPELTAARRRCQRATHRYNNAGEEVSRRRLVELWRDIVEDPTPLPPQLDDPAQDEALFEREPWIEPPIRMDYGFNVKVGEGSFINYNCSIVDTCLVTIGARTIMGPNVSMYSGRHPLDPAVRNGLEGPETGQEIHIGEDCWIAGNVTILQGDVPAFHLAFGNPARVIRKIETTMTE
ncbi:hypothetical protein ASPZODRAFT_55995 [Penicilliopsis zonata CBS 506.65]|uniref:Maltose/galactoside acetyltransferase domain-containing protein n=1 Tax=Penicilliopsis zonata CBS 506.65 TaxID=1073090 RepID=A0A1L9STI9_9EURO|nr:hypothetical protein ASPZODRAFT_55995 [Penicilliopsis zonata CBS 506.65]OJJ50520.1 hypothetical protein ASPZODRAFT_55995 [Penicilliopsis zonata CBS 506.65]